MRSLPHKQVLHVRRIFIHGPQVAKYAVKYFLRPAYITLCTCDLLTLEMQTFSEGQWNLIHWTPPAPPNMIPVSRECSEWSYNHQLCIRQTMKCILGGVYKATLWTYDTIIRKGRVTFFRLCYNSKFSFAFSVTDFNAHFISSIQCLLKCLT